ncbi:ankyrin [Coprinopsis marcescibilis]|uniref:Ankyrin n=1 Tax=Coprinopsis marcescibilis TaxID=230819 RepID=A0A5C3KLK7_COPMA|nr:ankyrin [Coprinopsis marcescibilis]
MGEAHMFGGATNLQISGAPTFINAQNYTVNYNTISQSDVPDDDLPKVIEWISEINYQDVQDDNLSKRAGDTGDWVFNLPVFQEWESSDGGMLWGTGMPGAGKTVLAAIIVKHLRARAKANKRILVAFAYCRYTDPLPVRVVLCALIRQILEDYPFTVIFVKPMYDEHRMKKTRPSQFELLNVLREIVTSGLFDQKFFSVDGLDEATSETQFDILDCLSELPVNFLVTSRPLPLLKEVVPEAKFIDIIVQDSDIERLIVERIRRMKTLGKLLHRDGWMQRVLNTVIEKSSGMFLVASLQIDLLATCATIKDLRSALEELPRGVGAMYAATIERIEKQDQADLAKRALTWLLNAVESIRMVDLQYALAADSETYEFDEELLVDADTLLSVCCGLVTLEPQSGLVRLVHYTATDYLKPYLAQMDSNPHARISSVCVARLHQSGFDTFKFQGWDYGYESDIFTSNPFLRYAHKNWAIHSHSSASLPPLVSEFVLQCKQYPILDSGGKFNDLLHAIHVAAAFNFHTLLESWPQSSASGDEPPSTLLDVNATTMFDRTPLAVAAKFGHLESVELLIGMEGVEVNIQDDAGRTPLILAAISGSAPVVRALLRVPGVAVNAADRMETTALMHASLRGAVDVVSELVAAEGINVNAVNSEGSNAVAFAARWNQTEVLKVLLGVKGIDVNPRERHRGTAATPLMHASRENFVEVVRLLLQHENIEVNATTKDGKTALEWALDWRHHGIAELLLAREPVNLGTSS